MANVDNNEVSHYFSPIIPDKYLENFNFLKVKLDNMFGDMRKKILKEEIDNLNGNEEDIDYLRYKADLLILLDLFNQGYCYSLEDNKIKLSLSQENAESKEFIRTNMSFEKNVQLETASVKKFILKMEKVKIYNNNEISIKSLIGSANEILNKYDNNEDKIIDPYVQLADNTVDANTGYKLKDIWRYFRYTWSIPYKNTPGRNLYYLVRDRAQTYHPIIGIFALGNCILNLTVRDNEIGWTLDAINNNMKRKSKSSLIECSISSKAKSVLNTTEYLESPEEYESRIQTYSKELIENFINSINGAISEIYVEDLHEFDFNRIKLEDIVKLREIASELKNSLLDTPHLDENTSDYRIEAQTPLYKKKRCLELSKLYDAKLIFEKYNKGTSVEVLKKMLKSADGIRAINVALVANRKTKIGSNMMEIIVCGSIPPYNELLGGKLVSILACSPKIIEDYKTKYANQVSEIASRMAGRKIVRDSSLAFLGTTSLYTKCSSQYNRIAIYDPNNECCMKFYKAGITEGFGTLFFSKETTNVLQKIQILNDGGRKINNVFGEGTSPRFRLLSTGFSLLGLKTENFLKHNSPRIVYMIDLAKNTKNYLLGIDQCLEYFFDCNSKEDIDYWEKYLIDFWYNRWFKMRIEKEDIRLRLSIFKKSNVVILTK